MCANKLATRDAYGKALKELGGINDKIVVLDADLSKSTKTNLFAEAFPNRFIQMGIAEADMVGTAVGLSLTGKIPFLSTFAIFATGRAYEQIRNSIAYPKKNVKVAATHAGLTVGEDGASHQSIEDIALMRVIPNMTVIVPADGIETELAIKAAANLDGPVYIRLGRYTVPMVNQEGYDFKIGKAVNLKVGTDVTIFATGIMVYKALEAATQLENAGISAEVINIHTIKPIDRQTIISSAQKTGAVITVEEHSVIGGLGSAVAEVLVQEYPVPMEMVGLQDTFGESGSPEELLEKYGLTSEKIYDAAKKIVARKK